MGLENSLKKREKNNIPSASAISKCILEVVSAPPANLLRLPQLCQNGDLSVLSSIGET
jgi:hypothetical protein